MDSTVSGSDCAETEIGAAPATKSPANAAIAIHHFLKPFTGHPPELYFRRPLPSRQTATAPDAAPSPDIPEYPQPSPQARPASASAPSREKSPASQESQLLPAAGRATSEMAFGPLPHVAAKSPAPPPGRQIG